MKWLYFLAGFVLYLALYLLVWAISRHVTTSDETFDKEDSDGEE